MNTTERTGKLTLALGPVPGAIAHNCKQCRCAIHIGHQSTTTTSALDCRVSKLHDIDLEKILQQRDAQVVDLLLNYEEDFEWQPQPADELSRWLEESESGTPIPAIPLETVIDVLEEDRGGGEKCVFVFDGHLFNDLTSFCNKTILAGWDVFVAAANSNHKHEMYEPVKELIPFADVIDKQHSTCQVCERKKSALFIRRQHPQTLVLCTRCNSTVKAEIKKNRSSKRFNRLKRLNQ